MGYDPQRKHQRRRVTEEDGPAPVDALLDDAAPTPPKNGSARPVTSNGSDAVSPQADADAAMPDRVPPVPDAPSGGYADAADRRLVIAVAGTVVVACVLLARRRRRRRRQS